MVILKLRKALHTLHLAAVANHGLEPLGVSRKEDPNATDSKTSALLLEDIEASDRCAVESDPRAAPVAYDDLRALATPEGTDTHVPVAHHEIVELMRYTLGFYGHEIAEEHHAVTPDGARYFGLMSLRSPYGEYSDTVGLRNSHDKSFPIGIAFGSRVFVCDNLAFIGEHVIRRKHTVKAKRECQDL
jgi:hypothetical protein